MNVRRGGFNGEGEKIALGYKFYFRNGLHDVAANWGALEELSQRKCGSKLSTLLRYLLEQKIYCLASSSFIIKTFPRYFLIKSVISVLTIC